VGRRNAEGGPAKRAGRRGANSEKVAANAVAKRRRAATAPRPNGGVSAEERNALILAAVAEGIYEWSVADNDLYVSPRLREMLGFREGELTSENWYERVHPDDKKPYRDAMVRYFKRRAEHFACEYRVLNKAGHYRWVSDRGNAVRDRGGRVTHFLGAIADITEQVATKQALQESEERYALATEAVGEGMYDWNVETDAIYYSPGLFRHMRLDPKKHRTAADWLKRIHPDDLPKYQQAMRDHFRGKSERFDCEVRYRSSEGEWRWARQHGFALRDKSGRAVRVVGATGDITERKRLAEELERAQQRLNEAIARVPDGFALYDAQDRLIHCNETFRRYFRGAADRVVPGAQFEEIMRASFDLGMFPDAGGDFSTWIAKVKRLRRRHREPREQFPWGDTWLRVSDAQTSEGGVVSVFTDVSDLRRRENELSHMVEQLALARDESAAARRTLAEAIEAVNEGFALYDRDDRLVTCNSYFRRLYHPYSDHVRPGVSFSELLDKVVEGGLVMAARGDGAEWKRQRIQLHRNPGEPYEYQLGDGRWMKVSERRTQEGGLVGIYTDITELKRRETELAETLERQTATNEILRVISTSPTDLQPVLNAVGENAARLCEADNAVIFRLEGDLLREVAAYGHMPTTSHPREGLPIDRTRVTGRAVVDRRTIHVHDLAAEETEFPQGSRDARRDGHRTTLATPLLREGIPIGAILIRRNEVRPFTEKQIELVATFADQAVIAIENVRLFNETKEALERQTATAEILRVISSTPADTQPVFDAIVTSTQRLLAGRSSVLLLRRDINFVVAAYAGPAVAHLPEEVRVAPLDPEQNFPSRAILNGEVLNIGDWEGEDVPEHERVVAKSFGIRSGLIVPLLREGTGIGAIAVTRATPGPYHEKEIALLRSFADQAVIAIENVRLFNETKEALERQTATSEVLGVISRSTTDLQPVLDSIVATAVRLCRAESANIWKLVDGEFLSVAAHSMDAEFAEFLRRNPVRLDRSTISGRTVLTRATVHIPDVLADPEYRWPEAQEVGKYRTLLGVPLLRGGEPIGVIALQRNEVKPFSDKEIELVTTFADQAVIAIENVRLFEEVQARTRELSVSLDQQTAIGEVLRIISSSPGEVRPVFQAVAERAARLCEAQFVDIIVSDGKTMDVAATVGELGRPIGEAIPLDRATVMGRSIVDKATVHVADLLNAGDEFPGGQKLAQRFGHRTIVAVPLIRQDRALGTILVRRTEVRPIEDKHIALLQTFADQAAIAIENARLFNETREALERQTATSEVLSVISRSTTELQPVLDSIVATAARLCQSEWAVIHRLGADGKNRAAAFSGADAVAREWLLHNPIPLSRGAVTGRAILDKRTTHIPDVLADPEYTWSESQRLMNYRTMLAVPLLREGQAIGTITMVRTAVKPYTEKQIELVTTFADQAVIAIENVRLFEEVQARTQELTEALAQQTATSEVLGVISRSTTELQPVLDTIAQTAARLCSAQFCHVFQFDGERLHFVAHHGLGPEGVESIRRLYPMLPGRGSAASRSILNRAIEHIPDVNADPDYQHRSVAEIVTFRSLVAVPMLLRDGQPIGTIAVARSEVGFFPQRQIELLQTFADQAVIAIENVRLFEEVQARTRELTEALEYQTATSELLNTISRSPAQVQPVLDTIAQRAWELCNGENGAVLSFDDELIHVAAIHGRDTEAVGVLRRAFPMRPSRGGTVARAIQSREVVYIPDVQEDADYALHTLASAAGFRSVVAVPMLKDGKSIGAVGVTARQPAAFSPRQIELLKTFADQAVIAIDNARLFEAEQARTRELTEALERQTATSEVLGVISRSKFDIQPVLDTIVETAGKLCHADGAGIRTLVDGNYRYAASYQTDPAYADLLRRNLEGLDSGALWTRAVLQRRTIHIPDALVDAEFISIKRNVEKQKTGGFRTVLAVPLLRDGSPVGVINLRRNVVEPFTDAEIKLIETFADQAVIAIENVRLFEEVQARTRDLTEALEQQTATTEILGVISRSLTDTQPVFDAIVQSASKLFPGAAITVTLPDGDMVRVAAIDTSDPARTAALRNIFPVPLTRDYMNGVAILDRRVVDIPDSENVPPDLTSGWRNFLASGYRALTIMPMLRGDVAIGALAVIRPASGPLSDKQRAILKTFADQAVIAIENARLFEEVQARTRELARSVGELQALGEVNHAVSSTLDLQTVLSTIVAKAVQLSGTDAGAIYVFSNHRQEFRLRATYGMDAALTSAIRAQRIGKGESTVGEAAELGRSVQVPDIAREKSFPTQEALLRAGFRSLLVVPLLQPGRIVGALVVRRRVTGEFAQETIDLVERFAAQSVLAIQNARLFTEIEEKGRQLELASQHKSQFLANMSHELRTPLNAILGYTELILDSIYGEMPERVRGVLARVQSNGKHLLGLINDVLDLSKIEAGQLTLTLADYAMPEVVQSVVSAVESLAAEKKLALATDLPADLPAGRGDDRRIAQVLLNLVGNAIKFTEQGHVRVGVTADNGVFTVSVNDSGPGIAEEDRARIFTEFQQIDSSSTRKKGGTGLGLSISKRIVEMHGGRIWVDSVVGQGSTFSFTVPVRVERQVGKPS
jgi:PAS domain S-box-containing protein